MYKVSLIICTKDRADQLVPCLNSLEKIETSHPWEIIIVNNNSTDNTQEIIGNFIKNSALSMRSVFESNQGLSNARNAGWRSSTAEFICYIDDDCYPEPDFIDETVRTLENEKKLGFIGGRVLLFDETDLPITIQTHNERVNFKPYSVITAGMIHGANFSFRREALIAADGFDPLFGAGKKFPAEDVDIMAELLRLGWHGAYDPAPVVYHHHGRKLPSDEVKLRKGYDIGRGAFFIKRLLKPTMKRKYFDSWRWNIMSQPLAVSRNEIYGAFIYLKDSVLGNR
ncbi:MAG TPA: glycosyltransferase family 2 protein [Cellvibrio sp.]|nr:glycosyltransferase family 2 protein [Cellvibrio sp.]